MKKMLSLVLVVMLLMTGVAFAEAPAEDMPFEGTWVEFEDGFALCVPSDWLEIEATEDMLAAGIFYVAASPDGARTLQLAWAQTTATALEEVQAELAQIYPEAAIIENANGIRFVTYEDAEKDVAMLIALDAEEGGMYMFNFTPASDAEYGPIALAIAGSLHNTAAAE